MAFELNNTVAGADFSTSSYTNDGFLSATPASNFWQSLGTGGAIAISYSFTLLIWFIMVLLCYCNIPVSNRTDVANQEPRDATKVLTANQIRKRLMKRIQYFSMELNCFADSLSDQCRSFASNTVTRSDKDILDPSLINPTDDTLTHEDLESLHLLHSNSTETDITYPFSDSGTNYDLKFQFPTSPNSKDSSVDIPTGSADNISFLNESPKRGVLIIPQAGYSTPLKHPLSPLMSNNRTTRTTKHLSDPSSSSSSRLLDSGDSLSSEQSYDSFLMLPSLEDSVPLKRASIPASIWRPIPQNCAICLEEYHEHDKVCWSSNPACQHVFHLDCAMEWLVTTEQKNQQLHVEQQRQRTRRRQSENDADLTCPCCRQKFLMDVNLHVVRNMTQLRQDASQPFM